MTDPDTLTSQSRRPSAIISVRSRDLLSGVGLVITLWVALMSGSTESVVSAGLLIGGAFVVPAPLAFVAGQLALLPAVTIEEILPLAIAQSALLLVITEPARQRGIPTVVAGTIIGYGGFVGIVLLGLQQGLMTAGGLLCAVVAGGTYFIRRATLVRLGLVDTASARDSDSAGEEGPHS